MDKVQKIREEVERIQLYTQSEVLKQVLDYIDEVQEEPVSEDLEKEAQEYVTKEGYLAGLHYNSMVRSFKAGANWQKQQDLIPSTELSNFIDKLSKQFPEVSFAKLSRIAVRVAKWQQQQEYTCYEEAFEDGAKWKAEQFEQERLKHCDELTEAQAEIESDFVTQHLKENNRTPTFIDAIEYGMQMMKEQMMKDAIDAVVHIEAGNYPYIPQIELYDYDKDEPLAKEGDKYKVILIEED